LEKHCSAIKNSIVNTITKNNVKTQDIGGTASTTEFMRNVLDEIKRLTPETGKNNLDLLNLKNLKNYIYINFKIFI
jgi:hypothetical protein